MTRKQHKEADTEPPLRLINRSAVVDPLQARWLELKKQRREIDDELRAVAEQMKTGVCDVCGTSFTRARVTKRYCSQACTMRSSLDNRREFDLEAIRAAFPVIEATHLMTMRSLSIMRALLEGGSNTAIADLRGVSPQRVSQIAHQAHRLASLVTLARESHPA